MVIFSPLQVLPTYVVYFVKNPRELPKSYPKTYEENQQKRKMMELKTAGRVLTSNYILLQTSAKAEGKQLTGELLTVDRVRPDTDDTIITLCDK